MRIDGRNNNEKRETKITRNFMPYAEGSVLIETGNTKVICTATIEDRVPQFLKGKGEGWVTSEYNMLPRSTQVRKSRSTSKGKVDGRTMEIQRLIGRSLRTAIDLTQLGEKTIMIDCDVLQADGGTRTASITGAFIALVDAVNSIDRNEPFKKYPIINFLSAISVGIIDDGNKILDLCYEEDSKALVDMNVVMTDTGEFVELQGTGEKSSFSRSELNELIDLAEKGNKEIILLQKEVLGKDAAKIGK